MCDLIRRSGIFDAGCEPTGKMKTLFDLMQKQQATVGGQQPAIEFSHNRLAGDGSQAGQHRHKIGHGGCGLAEMT